ncbi:hypothetical protein [Streptomyces sp. NPDC058291]|uniref:hypothetical protein n=1 Tax=Streptomyces sp. NPDC058291 TaxID=3346427 RepID=UPI0036ECB557
MHTLKRWLDRSPTAQVLLVLPLTVGVAALTSGGEHPVRWLIHGTLYSVVSVVAVHLQRRRALRAAGTDARGVAELDRKLRQHEVPEEPEERTRMRRLVDHHLHRIEQGARWLPYWLGSMGLVAIGMLVLGSATGSWLVPLCFTAFVGAFCCWTVWTRRRSLDRLRFMRAALQE